MILELIVLQKHHRHLLVDGDLVNHLEVACVRDQNLMQYTTRLLAFSNRVEVLPILYVERYARRWPNFTHTPEFNYWTWISGRSLLKFGYNPDREFLNRIQIVRQISTWRRLHGDVIAMDHLFNQYTAWRCEQEVLCMEELL